MDDVRPSIPDAVLRFLDDAPADSVSIVAACDLGYQNPRAVMRALSYLKARGKVCRVDRYPRIPGRGNLTRWALVREGREA